MNDVDLAALKEHVTLKSLEQDRRLDNLEESLKLNKECLILMKLDIAKAKWQLGTISFIGASLGGAIIIGLASWFSQAV